MALAAGIDVRSSPEVFARASEAVLGLSAYLETIIAERRRRPQDDLITSLVAVQAQEGPTRLSDEELLATCVLVLVAGHETTVNLIGNGTLALLQRRDQWEQQAREPARVANAVEELLRYDSPVQMTFRFALEDVEIGGRQLRCGDNVALVLGAANRDPEQFADPDRLDIGRQVGSLSSFGFGIHFCLGAPLARAEGQIALATLLRRLPDLRLATNTPEWRDTIAFRGLKQLPVTF
jgi:cytochrome P450